MKVRKAVIPAAGLGTRMLPISRAVPKEMLPIVDRPAISYLVDEAVASGITDILIITNRDKEMIEDYFDISPEYEQKLFMHLENQYQELLVRLESGYFEDTDVEALKKALGEWKR